jgi:uncharacterized surface anchored protein
MYNTPKKEVESQVSISKLDSDSKELVAGATLEVKDKDGNVIETFVSEDTAHIINGLSAGTYTVTETDAPDGYELSTTPVEFTVTEGSEEVVNVVVYNTKEATETSGEEIAVPPTGKNKTAISSMIGLIIMVIGSVFITKKVKKNGI